SPTSSRGGVIMADTPRKKKHPVRKKKPTEQQDQKFLGVFKKNAPRPDETRQEETVAGNGQVIQHKGAVLGKVLAWTFVAFVGVGATAGLMNLFAPPSTAEQVVQVGQTPEEQQAAEYARGFVGAWLRATNDDDSEIARYMQIERGDITAADATEYRELAVASSQTAENGVSTIIVSAEVLHILEADASDDEDESQEIWQPAWYQVNVYQQDGNFVPLGWPAPVPAPETGGAPRLSYSYNAPEEITETVTDFFDAYALGDGEVTRLTHPDSTIQPLEPPQYAYAEVVDVTTDEDHRNSIPSDETTTRAYVQLLLGEDPEAARAATYALTLETRGGRWEVRTLDPAPILNADQITVEVEEAPTPQASSSESESSDSSTE